MANAKNNPSQEETRLDVSGNTPQKENKMEPKGTDNKTTANKKSEVKNVVSAAGGAAVGAAGGAVIGGFSMAGNEIAELKGELDPVFPEDGNETADFVGNQVPVATRVNDSMSFDQAFAEARQELGAGGVFCWKGNWYGTYYADEWRNLSDEYKQSFSNYQYELTGNYTADADSQPVDQPVSGRSSRVNTSGETADNNEEVPVSQVTHAEEPALIENEVEVLGVQYAEVDGQTFAYAPLSIDGTDSVFIDVDTDGIFDVAIIDNGTDEPDVYDVSPYNISHQDVIDMQQEQQQESNDYLGTNDLPDYSNDGPVDNFV